MSAPVLPADVDLQSPKGQAREAQGRALEAALARIEEHAEAPA